jgi:chaperonin GroES
MKINHKTASYNTTINNDKAKLKMMMTRFPRYPILLTVVCYYCYFLLMTRSVSSFTITTTTSSSSSIIRQQHDTVKTVLFAETTTTTTETTDKGVMKLDGRKIKGMVQPCNNFLLVQTVDAIESTDGGIFLTGKAKIKKTEGTVIAVGPGKTHQDSGIIVPMPVTINDKVVYGKYDGTNIDLNGKSHTLIRDDDILIKWSSDTLLSVDSVDVINDNILVSVDTKAEVATEGGILLAQTSKSSDSNKRPSTGQVIKVGPGKIASNGQRITMDVSIGDMIKFRDYAGNEVEINGQDYSVVRMIDVLAKY